MLYAPIGRWCLRVASLTNRDPHSAPSPVLTAKQTQRTGPVSISCHSDTQMLPCYRCGDWWTPSGAQQGQWFHTPACTLTYTPAAWIILLYYYYYYFDLCSTVVVKRLYLLNCGQRKSYLKPLQGQTYDNMTFHSCPVNGIISGICDEMLGKHIPRQTYPY